jgi:FkbM family methyltransferase
MSAPVAAKSFRTPKKVLRRLRYLPVAMRTVRNWPRFMWNYALGFRHDGEYRFRNGGRLRIGRAIDHVPVLEIFFEKDYGVMPDGSVIIDLGANIGVFSVYASSSARGVTVYAYEPFPGYFATLQVNAALNADRGTVHCFNMAVAGAQGRRSLFTEGEALYFPTLVEPDGATGSLVVPCTTLARILDDHGLQRVDMLKLDCEGAEYEILYNTPGSYFDRIREIRMEYHNLPEPRANVQELRSFLAERGYDVWHMKENGPANGCLWARKGSPNHEP